MTADIARIAEQSAHFGHALETAPLATVIGWHTEDGTSQRRALQALERFKTVIVSGGNRSGKTYLLRAALVALALGSDHPHARLFWLNNGCDPDAFPRGPGEAYILALSSNDSVRYHREDVAALLPDRGDAPTCAWMNRRGKGEAHVRITVPGYREPAIVWFKSEDQGPDGIQGDAVRAILHDEEGKTPAVWDEAAVRLIDFDGWHLMANTPLNGRTWVWERFVRQTPPDVHYAEIWTEHNPFLPSNAVAKLSKRAKSSARLRGQWEVAEGLVYGSTDELDGWVRDRHVLTPQVWRKIYGALPFGEIPADWPRFRSQDFGTRNPGCVLWLAVDPEDRVILYRCVHAKGWTSRQWAEAIVTAEGGDASAQDPATWTMGTEAIERAWADPAGAQQMLDMRRSYGIRYQKGKKDWIEGRDACQRSLELGVDGTPGFFVLEGAAPAFVVEIEGYRYPERTTGQSRDEKPIKKNDHAMDAWRYAMVGILRWM